MHVPSAMLVGNSKLIARIMTQIIQKSHVLTSTYPYSVNVCDLPSKYEQLREELAGTLDILPLS